MAGNYVLLETIELNQTTASITFDNIPQTGYTDLKVVISARATGVAGQVNCSLTINGSTADFTQRFIYGDGSTANTASRSDNLNFAFASADGATTGLFSNEEFYFTDYAGSGYKAFTIDKVAEKDGTEAYIHLNNGLWSNTAAITSLTFAPQGVSYLAGTTASLYGIATVGTTPTIAPKATGGNMVSTDGTYWYHTFLSSGNFIPQTAITCDYLVVAGGGASGWRIANDDYYCGGGGGGGMLTSLGTSGGGAAAGSSLSLTATSYSVLIGAGGNKVGNTNGNSGNNSVFSTITATGGGGGAYTNTGGAGFNGGSGGGAPGGDGGGTGGSAVSPTQGYAGGSVINSQNNGTGGAGGGGAGSVGATVNGPLQNGGNGGAPLANSITGSSVYYAGGGRGGRGYLASNGTNNANYVYAPNTGSGGFVNGGANENGCSGVVIIRYPVAS